MLHAFFMSETQLPLSVRRLSKEAGRRKSTEIKVRQFHDRARKKEQVDYGIAST